MQFSKFNFKAIVLVLVGLVSFAAGVEIPAPQNPVTGVWIQQVGSLVPHAMTSGTLYYTKYENSSEESADYGNRVKSIRYQYDGAGYLLVKPSTKQKLCSLDDGIYGADGIVHHPDGDLLVAGQGRSIYKVNKTAKADGGGCLVKKTSLQSSQTTEGFWHLMMDPNGENLWAAGIPGYLFRFSTKIDPSNNNFAPTGYKVELEPKDNRSTDKKLTTLIWDGEGTAFFTHSDYQGGGCEASNGTSACNAYQLASSDYKNKLGNSYFGLITDTTWTEVTSENQSQIGGKIGEKVITKLGTKILIDSLEGAHGGAYDPYSNSIFVFGGAKIVQIQPYRDDEGQINAKVVATIDMREYFFEESVENLTEPRTSGVGWRLDLGFADSLGHLFVTSNSGHLIFVDYSSNPKKRIDDNVLIHVQWIDNYLAGLTQVNTNSASNYNALAFVSMFDSYDVLENTATGKSIGSFSVFDPDDGDVLTYTLTGALTGATDATMANKNLSDIFELKETANQDGTRTVSISVKSSALLDYEALYNKSKGNATYQATITVKDSEGHSVTNTMNVAITDVNEMVFAKGGTFVVNEHSPVGSPVCVEAYKDAENDPLDCEKIARVEGSDLDIYNTSFSTLTYQIIPSKNTETDDYTMFAINENTGALYTNEEFDYETGKGPFTFVVTVSDGTFSTDVDVVVDVDDIDETPRIKANIYTKGDFSENNNSWYGMNFELTNDAVTDISFDYCLAFFGSDVDVPASLEGLNFAEPADLDLEDDTYPMPLCSNDESGHVVIASGSRSPTAATMPRIKLKPDTDIEYEEFMLFKITNLSGTTIAGNSLENAILVKLVEYNKPPYFDEGIKLAASENTTKATAGQIKAQDDDGDSFVFGIVGGSAQEMFDIDPSTGIVTMKDETEPFDYEEWVESGTKYTIQVQVCDARASSYSEHLCSRATFEIGVADANEQPYFTNESDVIEIAENASMSSTEIQYADVDKYNTGAFVNNELVIIGGDSDVFEITSGGLIQLKEGHVLDYETQSEYQIEVRVRDASVDGDGNYVNPTLQDVKVFKISVVDVNEKPKFNESSYVYSIAEDINVEETNLLGSVAAVDQDAESTITYSLEGDEAALFSINASTGEIFIKDGTSFDYETKSSYTFEVVASDEILEDRVSVTVNIGDVNEKPVFEEASYEFTVAENAGQTVLGSVVGSDPDADAEITYFLDGEDSEFFVIDPNSGEITTNENATFDYEAKFSYSFEVVASDGFLDARVPVTVNVTNVPEPPVFAEGTLNYNVKESAEIGEIVATLAASDDDCKGEFSESCIKPIYSLSPVVGSEEDSDAFAIDSVGNIKVAKNLDYQAKSIYEYHVIATDGEDDSFISSVDVTINILDVPNVPRIVDDGRDTFNITENTLHNTKPTGFELACYVVEDKDLHQVTELTASLIDLNSTKASQLFDATIKQDGSLYKLCLVVKDESKLDYESFAHSHKVRISVTDPDNLSASLIKTINIADVNEKPSISGSLNLFFYEHEGYNSVVGQLYAEDPDSYSYFTDNVFEAVSGDTDLFTITEKGLIKTKRDFDYEKESRYTFSLDIALSDRNLGNYPDFTTLATVKITLKDSPNDPIKSSSSKAVSSSSSRPASSSSKKNQVSSSSNSVKPASSSSSVFVASSSSHFVIEPESSASSSNSNTSEYAYPTFHVRMVAPFEFEIVMLESLPSLARQYAVMDMKGQVLSMGELNSKETRVKVPTRGAYVVRVGLGYKRVNVK